MPYSDQWEFLSTISRMSREEFEKIVEKASREGKIIGARIPIVEEGDSKPWKMASYQGGKEIPITGPIPEKLNLILGNLIYIEKEDVMKSIAEEKRSPLLISERRVHVDLFDEQFSPLINNVIVFRGGMGRKQRQELYEKLTSIPDSEERLLIATGRYLGEGFDDARLDTLFLALPVSWRGTLAQYAGRLHRLHYNKKEVRIYDYVDSKVPLLEKMHKRRLRGYRSIGYSDS